MFLQYSSEFYQILKTLIAPSRAANHSIRVALIDTSGVISLIAMRVRFRRAFVLPTQAEGTTFYKAGELPRMYYADRAACMSVR